MTNRNIVRTEKIVTFYNGNDICGSDKKNFVIGTYFYDAVRAVFNDSWKPKLVKIDAGTTLIVYYHNQHARSDVVNSLANLTSVRSGTSSLNQI